MNSVTCQNASNRINCQIERLLKMVSLQWFAIYNLWYLLKICIIAFTVFTVFTQRLTSLDRVRAPRGGSSFGGACRRGWGRRCAGGGGALWLHWNGTAPWSRWYGLYMANIWPICQCKNMSVSVNWYTAITDLMITWTTRSDMASVSSPVLLLPVQWRVDGCWVSRLISLSMIAYDRMKYSHVAMLCNLAGAKKVLARKCGDQYPCDWRDPCASWAGTSGYRARQGFRMQMFWRASWGCKTTSFGPVPTSKKTDGAHIIFSLWYWITFHLLIWAFPLVEKPQHLFKWWVWKGEVRGDCGTLATRDWPCSLCHLAVSIWCTTWQRRGTRSGCLWRKLPLIHFPLSSLIQFDTICTHDLTTTIPTISWSLSVLWCQLETEVTPSDTKWQELPQGLAFLHLNSNQWPLAKLELAQPPEFWQGTPDSSGHVHSRSCQLVMTIQSLLFSVLKSRLMSAMRKDQAWEIAFN